MKSLIVLVIENSVLLEPYNTATETELRTLATAGLQRQYGSELTAT